MPAIMPAVINVASERSQFVVAPFPAWSQSCLPRPLFTTPSTATRRGGRHWYRKQTIRIMRILSTYLLVTAAASLLGLSSADADVNSTVDVDLTPCIFSDGTVVSTLRNLMHGSECPRPQGGLTRADYSLQSSRARTGADTNRSRLDVCVPSPVVS